MRSRVWLLPLTLGVTFAQSDGGPRRIGQEWIQVTSGNMAVPAGGRLKVGACGAVVVRGENRSNVSFSLKKRTRARSARDAARLFQEYSIKMKTLGDASYLMVLVADPNLPSPELEVRAPRSLRHLILENQGGSIEAHEFSGDVTADTAGGRIVLDRIGRSASARTGGGDVLLGRIGGSVRCISGGGSISVDSVAGESWLETVGGEIYIREAGGPVRASTAGNITVDRAARSVTAHSFGGMIEVRQAGGAVMAEASGGSVQVGSAINVHCELGAGPIRLRGVSGSLRASTGLGTILADLMSGAALRDSFLNTGQGDVIVSIPSNIAVRVWAQSDSACRGGKVVSEFDEIRSRPVSSPCAKPVIAEGSLNGGGPLLKVSAAGGTVYLRRQK